MAIKLFQPNKFRRRVFSQLWMLALQFMLGMALNLIGEDATGNIHIVYIFILVVHILNAIGLIEGGIFIVLKERSKLAWWALTATSIAATGGILTVLTWQDMWSFLMASGFLASSWLYGILYNEADRRLNTINKTARRTRPATQTR